MYLRFYDLDRYPFRTNPDPSFLWLGEKHREAFATLEYGIMMKSGFILLTGDVGTGKTTVVRYLLRKIGPQSPVAFIYDPGMPFLNLINLVAEELGMNRRFEDKSDFLIHFQRFLNQARVQGQSVFLIVDEAQRLSRENLEQIRLLSNIELDDQKLLTVFLVGQSEFRELLKMKGNEPISQRISTSYHIQPLDQQETIRYIAYRLRVAGAKRGIFTLRACKAIHAISQGIPRLINSICDCALLSGYASDRKVIDLHLIHECQVDLRIPIGTVGRGKKPAFKDPVMVS